jgi:hypothetical protein
MTKLTLAHIKKVVAADPRLDKQIDLDEPGKAIVYTADGWTWDPMDGDRTVEGFLINDENCDNDPQDTLGYFKAQVSRIQRIAP